MTESIAELIERIIDLKVRAESAPVDISILADMIVELDRKLREFESCKLEKKIEDLDVENDGLREDIRDLEMRIDKLED